MGKKISLKPMGNRVLITLDEGKKETAGGIILPDGTGKDGEALLSGVIVATGTGPKNPSTGEQLQYDGPPIGTRIMFSGMRTQDVEHDGEKYSILDVTAIFLVVPE